MIPGLAGIQAGLVAAGGGPTDPHFANVSLLAGFDVENDEGPNAFTITYTDYARDTTNPKFGTHCLGAASSSAGRATAPNDVDFQFGSGNWTIECWVRFLSTGTTDILFGLYSITGNQRSWRIDRTSGNLQLTLSSNGTSTTTKISQAWTPTVDQWYHVAADWDGTTYRLYVDGAVLGSATGAVTLHNSTADFAMGNSQGASSAQLDGRLDEVRITKGVARYAGAFTPPTAAFPRS